MAMDNKRNIYITGGTGFVGSSLIKSWIKKDQKAHFYIQTRDKEKVKKLIGDLTKEVDGQGVGDINNRIFAVSRFSEANQNFDVLINLAGASIAEGRWTSSRKKILRDSRIKLTEELASEIKRSGKRIGTVIQCSAVGFYGFSSRGEEPCEETASVGKGFSAKLCQDWELVSQNLANLCDRLVVMRLGVVLGNGGVLKKLRPIFSIGMGGPIGKGTQAFAWIHIDDVTSGILFVVENKSVNGAINFVSPEKINQGEFAKKFGNSLKRPVFMPTPSFVLKLVYGEMAEELLLGGCFVSSDRLINYGYNFRFPTLPSALNSVFT